jgi:hypothetical protein
MTINFDKRISMIGPLRIKTALLCEVVNRGHKYPDTTYAIEISGIKWFRATCQLCNTVVHLPANVRRKAPSPQEAALVQIAL